MRGCKPCPGTATDSSHQGCAEIRGKACQVPGLGQQALQHKKMSALRKHTNDLKHKSL